MSNKNDSYYYGQNRDGYKNDIDIEVHKKESVEWLSLNKVYKLQNMGSRADEFGNGINKEQVEKLQHGQQNDDEKREIKYDGMIYRAEDEWSLSHHPSENMEDDDDFYDFDEFFNNETDDNDEKRENECVLNKVGVEQHWKKKNLMKNIRYVNLIHIWMVYKLRFY